MLRILRVSSVVGVAMLASCHRGKSPGGEGASGAARPLEEYATQRIVLTPTARIRVADTASVLREHGTSRALGQWLDGTLILRLRERGLASSWIVAADLVRSYERNRSYASDPYQLAVEPLRAPAFGPAKKYGQPLASQLRTMIALHDDARLVLVPVELRFEGTRAVLRLALVDPRMNEGKWVGEVKSDSITTGPPGAALNQLAVRFADLFGAP